VQLPPLRRVLVGSTVVLATLFLVAVLAELAWRVHLQRTGRGFWDDPREFTSPFFTTYEEPPPFTTAEGFEFRNETVPLEKEPGEIRVICFGGSTTVCRSAGISYPQLVEPELAGKFPGRRVRVLNAGGDGFSTAHILVDLALRNLAAKPDLITVYENINDLSVTRFGPRTPSDYANKYETDFYLGMRHRSGWIAGLTKISRLARYLAFRVDAIRFPPPAQTYAQSWKSTLPYYEWNLRSILGVARAHGIRVALATQPARKYLREEAGFAAYNEAVRSLASEEGVPLIDVAREVTDDSLFLQDAIHYTRDGVHAVADVFLAALEPLVTEIAAKKDGARSDPPAER
jgi:lysophospholipase L1-like esterase